MSDKTNITVKGMVFAMLKANGYDGLYDDDGGDGCGCLLDDLAPCDDMFGECMAGYKQICGSECESCAEGGVHIGPTKESSDD